MKKILFILLTFAGFQAQSQILRGTRLDIRGYAIDTITNDTTGWISKTHSIPTAKAVYDFVINRAGGGGGTSDKADTVNNYTTLRTYSGTAKFVVNTDSRTGGYFKLVSSGSENGATIIAGTGGRIWQRVWDNVHWQPEFFEIGGKDKDGNAYNRLTGAGIGSEADAIRNIVLLAGRNATISFQNREYLIDRYIPAIENQKLEGPAILKRAAPTVTTLSNNESINSVTLEVANAGSFQAGQRIVVKGGNGYFGNNSVNATGNDGHLITSISGNTITIASTGIDKAMLAGDTVLTVTEFTYREGGIGGAHDTSQFISLYNIIFDGNKSQNYHLKDYQLNASIAHFGGFVYIRNCTFQNNPGENIYTAGCDIDACIYKNLNGTAHHWTNAQQTLPSKYEDKLVRNCIADSIGLIEAKIMGHSEGSWACTSTLSGNASFFNCRVTNAGFLFAFSTADDGIVKVIGGYYANAIGLGVWRGLDSTTQRKQRLIITGAEFINCGIMEISGTDARKGNTINGISITKNKFVNTRFYFENVVNLDFEGNDVYFDSTSYLRWYDSVPSGNVNTTWGGKGRGMAIYITAGCNQVRITNNIFQGFRNDTISYGIITQLSDSMYTKVGTTITDYYYNQDCKISGNTFVDFRFSTHCDITRFTKSTIGWEYSNNIVYMSRHSDFASDYIHGLNIPPGAVAQGNIFYNYFNTNYSWPIVAHGIYAFGSNETRLIGAKIINNTVYGKCTNPIYISPFDNSPYNVVVINNTYMSGGVTGGATGLAQSYRSGNVLLDNTNLPSLTSYAIPIFHRVAENKTNY